MNSESSLSRKLAIVLIIGAVFGTELSYHFTLESRFEAIEQKLQQDTVAMREMQDSMDTLSSSKTETLAGLNKQVEALQSSVEPIGKTTRDQTDALSQVRQEIAALQQAQSQQLDAQQKLSSGIAQLEKTRNDAARAAAATLPAVPPVVPAIYVAPVAPAAAPDPSAPAPATTSVPAPTFSHGTLPPASASAASASLLQDPGAFAHSSKIAMLPANPNSRDAVDLRPADSTTSEPFHSVRALPLINAIAR